MKKLLSLLLLSVLAIACNGGFDYSFSESDRIRLEIGGRLYLEYDESLGQLGFNAQDCCFSVLSDNASDYFILTLDKMPGAKGETVSASLKWTTPSSIESRKDIVFKVMKLEDDILWLYNSNERIAVCVKILV